MDVSISQPANFRVKAEIQGIQELNGIYRSEKSHTYQSEAAKEKNRCTQLLRVRQEVGGQGRRVVWNDE